MDIILNQIAVWSPCLASSLNVREMPKGERFLMPGTVIYRISETPIYRYIKNYTIKKVKFSLFVRTTYRDDKLVEQQLDETAKKLTKEYVLNAISAGGMNFTYTPYSVDMGAK